MNFQYKYLFLATFCGGFITSQQVFAQLDDDIVITKDRKVELPPASRVFEKIPPVKGNPDDRQMKYSFFDRKPKGIEEVNEKVEKDPPRE